MTEQEKNSLESFSSVPQTPAPKIKTGTSAFTVGGRQKIYLSIGFFIVFFAAFVIFLILPVFNDIIKNSEELMLQKRELALQGERAKNFEQFNQFYNKNKEGLEKAGNLLINFDVPIDFINFLEKVSAESSIIIKISSASSKPAGKELWATLSYQISATGSFQNFLKFLSKIESSPYLIEVQGLNITKPGKQQQVIIGEAGTISAEDISAQFAIKVFAK